MISFYSWNRSGDVQPDHNRRVTLYDETLRDGLQSSSVTQPSRIQKIAIIDAINRVGVETACLGFPAISNRIQKDCQAIARHISDNRLAVKSTLVARTLVSDIRSVLTVCDKIRG